VQCGLIPVFIDVEPDTYVIDVEKIPAMITPKTKAMMIPNLIGNLPDWLRLREIADTYGLLLVEDSADTIGYTLNGTDTGQLSDVATTSFYASHVMTAGGFGGMITVNDEAIFKRAALLRGWGRSSSLTGESENSEERFNTEVDGIPYDAKFMFESIGYNFLPSEISAAFGLVQLDRLADYIERRKRNFAALIGFFSEFEKWFILPRVTNKVDTAWLAVPLVVRDDAPFTRRELQEFMESREIQTRTIFTGNILRQPGFRDIERREAPGGFPNADQVMRGGLLLGCHQGLGEEEIAYVKSQFCEFAQSQ
jgi:CDP-4-dehydro-6-deoxyglucose reductase, E1